MLLGTTLGQISRSLLFDLAIPNRTALNYGSCNEIHISRSRSEVKQHALVLWLVSNSGSHHNIGVVLLSLITFNVFGAHQFFCCIIQS